MLTNVVLEGDALRLGGYLRVSLQRTLRVPDLGPEVTSALPVSLGCLPLAWAGDYPAAPAAWRQLSGRERIGAIQLVLHEATPGRFPDQEPPVDDRPQLLSLPQAGRALGLAPGGEIRQRIYRDPYGLKTWQAEPSASVTIHLLDSKAYEFVTGRPAPPPPIDLSAQDLKVMTTAFRLAPDRANRPGRVARSGFGSL